MTDAQLIHDVLAGDSRAYEPLVRRHHQRVLALCLSLLKNPSEAEDAAQDSFLKAYRSLSSFRGDSEFSTWIYRIAYRTCLDALRKRSREKSESWDALVEVRGEEIQCLFMSQPGPERALENKNLVERVLSTLLPDYRRILVLREVYGFSYEEIAAAMECSLDSVKARLRRARLDLAGKLKPIMEGNTFTIAPASEKTETLYEPQR
jgi:RNA polymerase sigma-70 factor, ECF subfamily